MAFSLYILECADGTLYIGHTDNLDERMRQHEMGKADAYTARRHPLKLLHVEEFETRYEALMMERKLKVGPGQRSWLTWPAIGTELASWQRESIGTNAFSRRFDFAAAGRYAQRER